MVGYLEDEAVSTYTKCLEQMDKGRLPQWTDPEFRIPEIAVKYWKMPEGRRTMRDLILYIRVSIPRISLLSLTLVIFEQLLLTRRHLGR